MTSKVMSDFYKTFFPTEEDVQRMKDVSAAIEKEAVERKHCIACSHYTYDASIPGFITYEGDCDLGYTAFFGDHPDGPCPMWEKDEEITE